MSQIKGEVTSLTDVLTHRVTAQNEGEEALLGHVRGDCHNGAVCALCKAESRAYLAETRADSIITGLTYPSVKVEPGFGWP